MDSTHLHTQHPRILLRLKRAQGHLRSVMAMIEEGRSCLDIAQQLHAVEAAMGSAKRELIHDHIENCLDAPAGDGADAGVTATLAELKALTKYL
jgi:DNA-binding FrmR family transcriptional regulator